MKAVAVFIFVFGLLSLKSGGSVLFIEDARIAAGNIVPFIVWFNVLAVPLYLVGAIAVWREERYGQRLMTLLFVAFLAADAYLIYHVQSGGLFEMRTVYAMTFRTVLFGGVALLLNFSAKSRGVADQPTG